MTLAISWSGLRTYEQCRQRHLRKMQRREVGGQNGRVFLAGSVADMLQREWLGMDDPEPGWMEANVETMMERFVDPTHPQAEDPDRVIKWRGDPVADRAILTNFTKKVVRNLEPILTEMVLPHKYQPELRFRTRIGIPYLDGRIMAVDLVGGIDIAMQLVTPAFEAAVGDYVLADLKATSNDSYIAKTLGQGIFYDIAWGSYIGDSAQPKRFAFIAPALDKPVIWATISQDDRRAMMARIVRFAHGMWKGDWEPKTSDAGCDYCEVRHACDKFAVHMTTDSAGNHRASFELTAKRRRQVIV